MILSLLELSLTQPVNYFFTRAKDTHQETGSPFITLFVRLTKEYTNDTHIGVQRETESVWVDIQEVEMDRAIDKITMLPNGVQTYAISEEVFRELVQLSAVRPEELYQVTPIHRFSEFKQFD